MLKYQKFVVEEIKILKSAGCISKHLSHWSAPVIIVPNKSDPNQPNKLLFLMAIDYRKINKAINSAHNSDSIVSYCPLPKISNLLARRGNCRIFSALDLHSGYHHIRIKPVARPIRSFSTISGELYWNMTPFGICSPHGILSYLMSEGF